MSKYEIPFLTACINAFGRRFSMTRKAAFRYLHEHKGLAFLIEFYDVEHLQSMDETIDDLFFRTPLSHHRPPFYCHTWKNLLPHVVVITASRGSKKFLT